VKIVKVLSIKQIGHLFDKRSFLGRVVLLCDVKIVKVLSIKQVGCLFDKRCLLGGVVLLCCENCKSALNQTDWASV